MPFVYLALLIVLGTMAIAIIVFTLVMVGGCASSLSWSSLTTSRAAAAVNGEKSSGAGLDLSPYSASSFRYRKEEEAESGAETECVVCLTGFEDDEEVRRLHRCNHCFHAPCIDMWMYSHSNCPICRTPVHRQPDLHFSLFDRNSSSSTHILIDIIT